MFQTYAILRGDECIDTFACGIMLALMRVKAGWWGFDDGGMGPPIYGFLVIPGLSIIGGGGWAICIEVLSDTFGWTVSFEKKSSSGFADVLQRYTLLPRKN